MEINNYIELTAERVSNWEILFWRGFYPTDNSDSELTNYEDRRGI